jgi:peptidylprolyl isomerase
MIGMMRSFAFGAVLTLTVCAAACGGAPESAAPPPPPAPPAIPAPADVAAPPATAERTASGIASVALKPGTGTIHPTPTSTVVVHYTGWKTNGEMFDSSVQRGEPAEFRLDGVIAGWTEGLQLMVFGEKRRFWIPGALAYDSSTDPSRPKGMLVFDVELIDIK